MSNQQEPSEELFASSLPGVELEQAIHLGQTNKRRWMKVSIVLAFLSLIVLLLWPYIPKPISSSHRSMLSVSRTSSPLVVATITTNVSYATLIANKHTFQSPTESMIIFLNDNENDVTLEAPPFLPFHCSLSKDLRTNSSRCLAATVINGVLTFAWNFTIDDLPLKYRDQVTELVTQARFTLSEQSRTVIPVGHAYLVGYDTAGYPQYAIANQPLQTQMQIYFTDDCNAPPCVVDALPGWKSGYFSNAAVESKKLWYLNLKVSYGWSIQDHSISSPPIFFPDRIGDVLLQPTTIPLYLQFEQEAGWSMIQPERGQTSIGAIGDSLCDMGITLVSALISKSFNTGGSGLTFTSPTDLKGGCQITAYTPEPNSVPAFRFIYRFGVLMASDQKTHQQFPTLPLASTEDIRASTLPPAS